MPNCASKRPRPRVGVSPTRPAPRSRPGSPRWHAGARPPTSSAPPSRLVWPTRRASASSRTTRPARPRRPTSPRRPSATGWPGSNSRISRSGARRSRRNVPSPPPADRSGVEAVAELNGAQPVSAPQSTATVALAQDTPPPSPLQQTFAAADKGSPAGMTRLASNDPAQSPSVARAPDSAFPRSALDEETLVRSTEAELGRIGCYAQMPSSRWTGGSQAALARFVRQAKLGTVPKGPDPGHPRRPEEPAGGVLPDRMRTRRGRRRRSVRGDRQAEGRAAAGGGAQGAPAEAGRAGARAGGAAPGRPGEAATRAPAGAGLDRGRSPEAGGTADAGRGVLSELGSGA